MISELYQTSRYVLRRAEGHFDTHEGVNDNHIDYSLAPSLLELIIVRKFLRTCLDFLPDVFFSVTCASILGMLLNLMQYFLPLIASNNRSFSRKVGDSSFALYFPSKHFLPSHQRP